MIKMPASDAFIAIRVQVPDGLDDSPLRIQLVSERNRTYAELEIARGFRLIADEAGVRAVPISGASATDLRAE